MLQGQIKEDSEQGLFFGRNKYLINLHSFFLKSFTSGRLFPSV